MKKTKKWIKQKIRKHLGIDRLENKCELLYKSLASMNIKMGVLERQNQEIKELNEFLISQFNVSADIGHHSHPNSWAVLSIQGNRDYVKFVDLSQRDIVEINQYLRKFEGTNRIIDSPYGDLFKF